MYNILIVMLLLITTGLLLMMNNYTALLIASCIGVLLFLLFMRQKEIDDKRQSDLGNLSSMIEEVLAGNKAKDELAIEDTLVSKLYHQNRKLIKLLDGYHEKELSERKRLEQLIGDISHQLKTPFSNVKMYQELLMTCQASDRERLTQALSKQTDKMSWLIESLMLLSRVESGCLNINMIEADLNQTILSAINMIHPKAVKKDIHLEYEPKALHINHDIKWSSEAIFNILDNAVKYSGSGSTIKVNVTTSDMFASISVLDQGIGINEDDLNKIFKRFYRGDVEGEGVGIGLYLSQEIMMKQGGYIYCKRRDSGSEFIINMRT